MTSSSGFAWLTAALLCLLGAPALAADDARVDSLERQLKEVEQQLADLKRRPDAIAELKHSSAAQIAQINKRLEAQPRIGLDNGRLSIVSADGDFSFALRSTVQLD